MNRSAHTLLLVEDEPVTAKLEYKQLEDLGYKIFHVSTGEAAVSIIEDRIETPDLILMDIDLGEGMDGTEAARTILQLEDIPILFLSSHTEPEVVAKTEEISSYGYIVKNTGITVLEASIKMAFRLKEARMREREKEEEMRKAQEVANFGHWILEPATGFLSWSDQIYRIFDLPVGEISVTWETFLTFVHPEDREGMEKIYEDSLNNRSSFNIEHRVLRKDGTIRFVEERCEHMVNSQGDVIRSIGTVVDITERIEKDRAIQESEYRYRSLFDNLNSGVALFRAVDDGRDFIIIDFNPAAEKIDNINKNEVLGTSLLETFPGVVDFGLFDVMTEVWKSGNKAYHPVSFYKDDREDGWRENWVYRLPSGEVVTIYDDVSSRMWAEREVELQKNRLDYFMEGVNAGTWEWNIQTGEIKFNKIWASIIGYTFEELSPVSRNTLNQFTHPDDLVTSNKLLEEHFSGKSDSYEMIARMKHKEGYWVWVLDRGKVVSWTDDGKPLLMFGTCNDITELKHIEIALQETLNEKQFLLSELQHRAKNSFNILYSMVSLKSMNAGSQEVSEALNDISSRIKSMAELYTLLYKTDAVNRVGLHLYIEKILESLEFLPGTIEVNSLLEKVVIDVKDAVKVGLIVTELLTNAAKHAFMPGETGEIKVVLKKRGHLVDIIVSDNGKGLPAGFDIDKSTGLGLEFIQAMVKDINGTMSFSSSSGSSWKIEMEIER